MAGRAIIRVGTVWSELTGVPMSRVKKVLAPLDPKRQYSAAYREETWDGRIRLHEDTRFPTGLVPKVAKCLRNHKKKPVEVEIRDRRDPPDYNPDGIHANMLEGVTLWEHQLAAVRALITKGGGVLVSPTASGKTAILSAVFGHLFREYEMPGLLVVPKRGLAHQTVKAMRGFLPDVRIGQWGDGQHVRGDVTVATAASLNTGRKNKHRFGVRQLEEETEALGLDETHHAASAQGWYEFCLRCEAHFRFGVSATPLRSGDKIGALRLQGAVGAIIHTVSGEKLTEQGLLARPKVAMVMCSNASVMDRQYVVKRRGKKWREKGLSPHVTVQRERLHYADAYNLLVVDGREHNRAVALAVCWMVRHGRKVLCISRRLNQLAALAKRLDKHGVRYRALAGPTETRDRDYAKNLLKQGRIDCLLATTIFDEGEDVPAIDAVVLAEGVRTNINALQRIGRGMRRKKGDNDVWVVDFVPVGHAKLMEHGLDRCVAYESSGYETRLVDVWPRKAGKKPPKDLLPFVGWDGK